MLFTQANKTDSDKLKDSFSEFLKSNDFTEQISRGAYDISSGHMTYGKKEIINRCFFWYLYEEVLIYGRKELLAYIIHNSAIDIEAFKENVKHCEWVDGVYLEKDYGMLANQFYRNCAKALADLAETDYSLIECLVHHESSRHRDLVQEIQKFLVIQNKFEDEFEVLLASSDGMEKDAFKEKMIPRMAAYANKMDSICLYLAKQRTEEIVRKIAYTILYYIATDKTEREFLPMQMLFEYVKRRTDKKAMHVRDKEELFAFISDMTEWTDDIRTDSVYQKYLKKHVDKVILQIGGEDPEEQLSDLIQNRLDELHWRKIALSEIEGIDYIQDAFNGGLEHFTMFAEKYYEAEFLWYWDYELDDRENISKLDILRYMPARDYQKDLQDIIDMILEDEMYFNLRSSMFDYVEDHAFFAVPADMKGLRKSFQAKVELYKAEAEEYRNRLARAEQRNEQLKTVLQSDTSSAEMVRQDSFMEKQLASKEQEIEELRRQLASQNAYIDMLTTETEEVDEELTYDLAALQGKRYVFFCYMEYLTNELRKVFPNSKFVDNNRISLDGIKVDGVVVIVKGLKHSMYYKIRSVFQDTDTEILMFNNNNLDRLYYEMGQMFLK